MGKADLHVHSTYSHDSSSTIPAILNWAADSTELDVIAITDHDKITGALEAREIAPRYGIEVIPGIEVTSSEGHVLALFVEKPIPAHRPLLETVLRVGEQGGVCIVAHPEAFMVHGASRQSICQVLAHPEASRVMQGVEVLNTGLWFRGSNERTQCFAEALPVAQTGSSDSHLFWTIGSGYTQFPGHTAQDFRQALQDRTTQACQREESRSLVYYVDHLFHFTVCHFGWVTWTSAPHAPLHFRHLSRI